MTPNQDWGRRPRRRQAIVTLSIVMCSGAALAQDAHAQVRSLKTAGADFNFEVSGAFALTIRGVTRISHAGLRIFGPKWKSVGQTEATPEAIGPGPAGDSIVFAGTLKEPASGELWRYREEVKPGKDRVEFAYLLEPQAEMDVNEVSLILDLPIDLYRGKKLVISPGTEAVFPPELPKQYHFVAGVGRALVFGSGESPQVALTFPKATYCNVQDTRQWKGDAYQAFVKIIRSRKRVKPGQKYELRLAIVPDERRQFDVPKLALKSAGPLAIKSVTPSSRRVKRYELFELRIGLSATYDTPFDPDQVSVEAELVAPSGKRLVVPGFFYQDYEIERVGDLSPVVPKGEGEWRVRFAPAELGKYTCKVAARDRSGTTERDAGAFTVEDGASHGYIRVSEKDHRYFEFDDGTPYFAIGENVCWYGDRGVADYDEWFGKLGANGANYARIWMPRWAFGLEWDEPGIYRLDRAWQLDYALNLAEREGVYVKLCLENFRRWTDGANPYDAAHGGPCEKEMDIFTNAKARDMFKKRLRYIVARWGYSTHIMGWELWNEINCVNGYRDDAQAVVDWTDEMCRYLKQIDPWQHLTTNSLGSCRVDDRYWSLRSVDWAQVHGYYYFSDEMKRDAVDMARFLTAWLARIDDHDKPALFAEFGLTRSKPEVRAMCDEDEEGAHLHNGIWAPPMSGSCGTAMLWWWDSYVEPKDLYWQFGAFARFAEGVPWTTAGFRPVQARSSAETLRVFGLQGNELTLLWLQNARHTWWNVVHGEEIPRVIGATVQLPELPASDYRVEWWDTYEGKMVSASAQEATAEGMTLRVPPVPKDVAVKIKRR